MTQAVLYAFITKIKVKPMERIIAIDKQRIITYKV